MSLPLNKTKHVETLLASLSGRTGVPDEIEVLRRCNLTKLPKRCFSCPQKETSKMIRTKQRIREYSSVVGNIGAQARSRLFTQLAFMH